MGVELLGLTCTVMGAIAGGVIAFVIGKTWGLERGYERGIEDARKLLVREE